MAKTTAFSFVSIGAVQILGGVYTMYQAGGDTVGITGVSGMNYTQTYVRGFSPNTKPSATATVQSIKLTFHVSGSGGAESVYAGALSSAIAISYSEVDAANNFRKISAVPATWTIPTGQDTTITVTDAAQIKNILAYGVGVRKASGGYWTCGVSMSATYTYSDPYEPADVEIVNTPSIAYLSDELTVSWSYKQAGDVEQYAVDVEIGSVAVATKYVTASKSYTVDLKDMNVTNGTYTIRVRVYTQGGSVVSADAAGSVILENNVLRIVSPQDNDNVLANENVQLRWAKSAEDTSKSDPYAFDVEYSTNAGESWTTVLEKQSATKSGSEWYVVVSANTLPQGMVQWRVRPWSSQYNAGNYAKASFYAVVQASTSAVSCDGKPLPTLSWESRYQTAYQVRFADYDSGAVYGSGKSHTVPYAYADGLYAVQVRTQATTGEWSAWSEVQYVQIRNSAPAGSVGLTAEKTRNTVTLTWATSGTFAGYILYRGKTPIYAGTEKKFTDVMGNGKNTYTVRAVTADKYYAQSAEVIADATPATDCIYRVSAGEWISLKYSTAPRRRQFTDNKRVSYKYYAGRTYPVTFTEGFSERVGSFSYCFREREQADAVAALAGETVVYKGTDGSMIRGTLNGVSRMREIVSDITFTITETDYEEKVPYAAS